MTLAEKIAILKTKMNHSYSSFAQTLNSTSFGSSALTNDYANAIVFALRLIGKEVPIWKKSIMIPIEPEKRYYAVYPNLYSKEQIDFAKPTGLAFIHYSNERQTYIVGDLPTVPFEAIEKNQYVDVYYFAEKLAQTHMAFKSSAYLDVTYTGTLNKVSNNPTGTSLPVTTSVTTGSYIYNLEFAEKMEDWYTQAQTTGTTVTTADNTQTWGWAKDDILWAADGMTSFMIFTFTGIPLLTHFVVAADTTGITAIPIMNQFLDDIDDIAMNYLYSILLERNPEIANIYAAKLKMGLIKTSEAQIAYMKRRARTMESAVIDSYNYKGTRYGR